MYSRHLTTGHVSELTDLGDYSAKSLNSPSFPQRRESFTKKKFIQLMKSPPLRKWRVLSDYGAEWIKVIEEFRSRGFVNAIFIIDCVTSYA